MYAVLEMHQKRYISICPLILIPYHNHGETLLIVSHHANDTSKASHHEPVDCAVPWPHHPNDTFKASQCQPVDNTVLHHTNDTSKTSHHQPVDHTDADIPNGNQDNNGANEEIEHGSNNNSAEDEDKDENIEVNAPKQQQPHTFNNDICPSQLH